MIYIVSIIIFKQPGNTKYSNFIDLILLGSYMFYLLMHRKITFKLNNEMKIYFLFVAISLASFMWAYDSGQSIKMALRLVLLSINMILIYNIINEFKIEKYFMNALIIGSFFNYFILMGFIHVNYYTTEFNRFTGTTGNPNSLAIMLIFSILMSVIYLEAKKISFIYIMINYLNIFISLYVILATVSKKGIIFAAMILFIYFTTEINNFKKIIIQVLVVSIVAYFVLHNMEFFGDIMESNIKRMTDLFNVLAGHQKDASTTERLRLINAGLDLFSNSPILGIGIDNFKIFNEHYAHNNYIELLACVGMVGVATYYLIFYFLFKKISTMNNKQLKKILYGYLIVVLLMDVALVSYYSKLNLLMIVFISIIAEKYQNKKKTKFNVQR